MTRFDYDSSLDPPAAVVPVRVGAPGAEDGVAQTALVDTGADLTAVPAVVAAATALPVTGEITVRGVGGGAERTLLHAAEIQIAEGTEVVEVVAVVGRELLLGRNLLNRWVVHLDGPEGLLDVARPEAAR